MYVLHVLQIETRGLPAGVVGPIRVMTIEGIDENMCCGTHVSNLSHLQVTVTCLSSLGYLISLNILLIYIAVDKSSKNCRSYLLMLVVSR